MKYKSHRSTSERLVGAGLFVTTLLGFAASALADMNSISLEIWKMKYGVTAAQVADNAWMNSDSDGDGMINQDEVAAGTNPFVAGSKIGITSITSDASNVYLTFPTEAGKQYVVQGTPALTTAFAPTGVTWIGTGVPKNLLPVTKGGNQFFRLLTQDIDSDGDGASNWAEKVAGYDPTKAMTDGTTNDAVSLTSAIASSNVVTVVVTKPSATQPAAASAPVIEAGSITIARSGPLDFSSPMVPLQISGSATVGTDYDLEAAANFTPGQNPTANFTPGVTQIVLEINPKFNSVRRSNVTAIVKALAGPGFTLGLASSGGVVINPAGIANGTGLTGTYYKTANGTYSNSANFQAGQVGLTRTDATINFSNGSGGWGSSTGPTGMVGEADGVYSIRWTGQILPQYSEKYFIDFRSDDSAKVSVNGVLLIDRWVAQGATDYINTIELTGGVLYDIQIDYWNNAGTAEAKLYWWSASQPKQIIPQGRLFPAPALAAKLTAVTNPLTAVGYVGTPFSFSVVTPNISGGVTYAVAADSGLLPPGLSLNVPAAGAITGIPSVAGTYNVAINALNSAAGGAVTGSSIVNFTIYPAGSVTRETLAGATITADGTLAPPTFTGLDDDTDYPNNTSRRLRGFIVPPKTGNYYFWVAASNTAELWISNDSEYVNRVRRATVAASTGKKVWNAAGTQKTQWLYLVAGQKYYFDVLHNTGTEADDHVAVGWCQDDIGTVPAVTGDPNPTGLTPLLPNGGAALQGYPLSGTAPIYIFQPYDYPTSSAVTGALYSANLGPQGASTTKASGSANLRVDPGASPTSAVLHFTYQGLSSPKTAYHLHVDAFSTHPAGEIVFDIDDVDSFHPELKTEDGGYIWNFAAGGTFTSIQQVRDAISLGKVYLNVHSVTYPAGEIRGNLTLIDGSQTPPDAAMYAEPTATDVASDPTGAAAARFLNQATFGASPADVAAVKTNGFSGWIDDQLTKPASRTSNDVVAGLTADINVPYPSTLFTNAWWKYSITGQDQLRQRLAFALSEILVVSWNDNTGPLQNNGRVLSDYYDNLLDYCLPTPNLANSGNFRGVLKSVTLSPAMGLYLDMRGNQKEDISIGRHPNENYAREIMQLFSVGINRVWDDGKFVLNSNAEIVPTYTQPTILGLSTLLTGWNYGQPNQANGRLPTNFGPGADYLNAMVLVPTQHDIVNAKLLLDNVVTPAATGLVPRVTLSSVTTASPCKVITATVHGLKAGDTVRISGVNGGSFSAPINGMLVVTNVVDVFSFNVGSTRDVATNLNCTVAPTGYSSPAVTGATVTPATYTSALSATAGSQADNAGGTVPHPYDQYGLKELDVAVDNIVNNDNVPPYICRQLIQRLVTSDPSPGYLYRVVQKWKNNGSGVRGDLAAVVRQILLDGEARSTTAAFANTAFGKQREPMLRITGPARAFPAASYSGIYAQLTGVNSHKLRIITSALNDFSAGFAVGLDFRSNYTATSPPNPYTNPTSTNYSVGSTLSIAGTLTEITSIALGNPCTVTTSRPHGLSNGNTVTISGVTGTFASAINATHTISNATATSFTVPVDCAAYMQVQSIAAGSPCMITTVQPHGLSTGNSVTINGVSGGTFSPAINATFTVTVTGSNTFTVPSNCTVTPTSITLARHVSNPCKITMSDVHGLTTGDVVTISGVGGGAFNPTISNATFSVTVVDGTSFTIPVNCTAPSTADTGNIVGGKTLDVAATGIVNATYSQAAGSGILTVSTAGPPTNIMVPGTSVNISSIAIGNPCTVTTSAAHNLISGGVVVISGAGADGIFTTAINGTFVPAVTGATTFTVPVECTAAPTSPAGSTTKRIRSRIYLKFLTQTTAGGAAIPGDGIFDVLSNPTGSTLTIATADTPATGRGGNVLLPKLATSYTPQSSDTIVQFNVNVNHNLLVGQNVWVDVPVVGSPLSDAEYTITATADEDHFKTSYLPANLNGGTYPKPSGSNNGITLYPLVPPPLGRSGTVTISQSTFNIASTEGSLAQSPLNAPTVFNYFFPDYKFPGTLSNNGVDSPEFQLSTDTNLSNLNNSITNMVIGTGGGNANLNGLSSFNNGNGTVVMDIGNYMTDAKTSNAGIPALIDELASLLVGAPLEGTTKTTIQNFVANNTYFPYTTPTNQQKRDRVRAIIHLIITSAEYAVQK